MPLYHTEAGTVETLEWGDGPEVLILLHAAATGPRSLAALAERLAAPGRRIVAPALHGYGATLMRDAADRLHAHVRVVEACMRQHDAERRVLFGHSMGGLVALLAVMAGAPVGELVLYEPIVIACLRDDDPADVACRAWDRAIVRAVQTAIAAGTAEAGIARFIEAWNETPWSTLPAALRARMVANASELVAEIAAVSFCPLDPRALATIATEVRLLQGADSPEITRRMTSRLGGILPRAQRTVMVGTGHMGPVQAPDRVARVFLSNRPSTPGPAGILGQP